MNRLNYNLHEACLLKNYFDIMDYPLHQQINVMCTYLASQFFHDHIDEEDVRHLHTLIHEIKNELDKIEKRFF